MDYMEHFRRRKSTTVCLGAGAATPAGHEDIKLQIASNPQTIPLPRLEVDCFPFPVFVFCASFTSSAIRPLYVSESCCSASRV